MSMARYNFCCAVTLKMLFAAVLYVATSVGDYWWTIYDRSVLVAADFWKFSKNLFNYVSAADAITFLIMIHSTCTRLYSGGIDCISVLDFGPRKKYSPALLCASGSEM